MITKCPHCSALLDCPQDMGSIVDCAGCGKSFYALPCDEGEELEKAREAELESAREAELMEARRQREVHEAELKKAREAGLIEARRQREVHEAELKKAREADLLKAREKELIEIREARRQREVREAELKETRRQQERAELLKQQMELSHHVKEIQGDALALAAIGRGSGWAGIMKFLGTISIIIGVVAFIILMNDNNDQAFPVFAISIGAGITCLFNAFLLDVFTDIRWLLSLLARPDHDMNK